MNQPTIEQMKAFAAQTNLSQSQQKSEEEKEKDRLIAQMKVELNLENVKKEIQHTIDPVSFRKVGEKVYCEVFGPSKVIEVLENGRIYRVEPDEPEFKQYQLYKAWYKLQDLK